MSSESRPKVLVIEDDAVTARLLSSALIAAGYEVVGPVETGLDALDRALTTNPDIVLADILLEGEWDGIQTVHRIRERMDIPVVYLTADSEQETLQRAKLTRPAGFLSKPFNRREIGNTLEIALYRHRSEANQRLYQRAIAASVSAIFIADAQVPGVPILQVNPSFEQMTGYSAMEAVGKSCWLLEGPETDPAASAELHRALDELRDCRVTLLFYRKDQSTFWCQLTLSPVPDASGRVTHFVGVQHDVTTLRTMEAQLRQTHKLEAIGQLAGGIAHEINTPMQYLGDNTRFLRDAFADLEPFFTAQGRLLAAAKEGTLSPELIAEAEATAATADIAYLTSEIPKSIEQSLEGINRVSTIVRAMKEFSQPGVQERVNLDLNHAIESTLTVCRHEWSEVAEVRTQFDPRLPLVPCLAGEFNQTMLNLIVNASHAIAELGRDQSGQKGTIAIQTQRDTDHVEIRVSDTGTGIPETIRHRIFDPFFSTKGVGKGTGQGLAIAWNVIVDKHGGTIVVETEMGKGTTFIVRLPIAATKSAYGK